MQIDVKGRNVSVSDEQRARARRCFAKIDRQLSALAHLEVEFSRESNRSIADPHVVDLTLTLKGTTLRVRERSREPIHALNLAAEELARQVKRHREKRRDRRTGQPMQPAPR